MSYEWSLLLPQDPINCPSFKSHRCKKVMQLYGCKWKENCYCLKRYRWKVQYKGEYRQIDLLLAKSSVYSSPKVMRTFFCTRKPVFLLRSPANCSHHISVILVENSLESCILFCHFYTLKNPTLTNVASRQNFFQSNFEIVVKFSSLLESFAYPGNIKEYCLMLQLEFAEQLNAVIVPFYNFLATKHYNVVLSMCVFLSEIVNVYLFVGLCIICEAKQFCHWNFCAYSSPHIYVRQYRRCYWVIDVERLLKFSSQFFSC